LKNFFYYNAGNGENMVYLGIKNIAMLQSMKKPDPKKKKFPVGKTVVAYEKKSMPSSAAPKSISKADAEANLGRMRKSFEDYQDDVEGEKVFGSDYKDLGLKANRYRKMNLDGSNPEVVRKYRVKGLDENPDSPYREEVEMIDPNNKILRIYRTKGKNMSYIPDSDITGPEYNKKRRIDSSPFGEPATVYEETIKHRAERIRAAKKANDQSRVKSILDKVEADKAKAKAGGK
jgi:hypothetical protein